ncbi:TPM domain-containing protein [Pseudomonas sp. MLB6B]
MTSLTPLQQRQIVEAVAGAERRTAATLHVVLARRTDDYPYLPLFCAALLALAVPWTLQTALDWHLGRMLLLLHGLLFVGLCLLLRHPRLSGWLVPPVVRRRQTARLACRHFELQGVREGLSIFVCEAERHVQILHEAALAPAVSANARHAIEQRLRADLAREQLLPGLLLAIERCAELLEALAPQGEPTPPAQHLVAQRLVLLD